MTQPFFTIITPSLQRDSLIEACSSVTRQSFSNWQHIVMIDCEHANYDLWDKIEHPNRQILWCNEPHKNGGNTCRHNAWEFADGEYLWGLDDDNYISDKDVLRDVASALEESGKPTMGLFPIMRLGGIFYSDPPRSCHVDTLNFFIKREQARWPDTSAYGSDGVLIDSLMEKGIDYVGFPHHRPVAVIPIISFCK